MKCLPHILMQTCLDTCVLGRLAAVSPIQIKLVKAMCQVNDLVILWLERDKEWEELYVSCLVKLKPMFLEWNPIDSVSRKSAAT